MQSDQADGGELGDLDVERRDKLRRAGEAYFAKVLAAGGKDPLPAYHGGRDLPPLLPAAGNRLPASTAAFDPDLAAVGAVVEGARSYVLGTLLVASQACSLVFIKASLTALRAPALLAVCHLVPVLCTLWLLASHGAIDPLRLSLRAAQGAAPTAALAGLQMLFLFKAALRCSVFVVLSWSAVVPHAVGAALAVATGAPRPVGPQAWGLATGAAAAALATLAQWPGVGGVLVLLLWAATEVGVAAWAVARRRPEALSPPLPPAAAEAAVALAAAERSVDAVTLAWMQAALPVVPLILVGFVLLEGRELADHELSVPAVSMVLLSCGAWTVRAVAALLLSDGLPRAARGALLAAGPLGTVVVEAAVHGLSSALGCGGAAVAAAVGMLLRLLPEA